MTQTEKITPELIKVITPQRFWTKIKFGTVDECWEWTGALSSGKYGHLRILGTGKTEKAHRHIYKIIYGDVDTPIYILHKCDNPKCVNPNHLFAGTQKVNSDDMISKGREFHPSGENHWSAKLTEEQVRDIKLRLSNGASLASLAKLFSISKSSISDIKRSKSWKHL